MASYPNPRRLPRTSPRPSRHTHPPPHRNPRSHLTPKPFPAATLSSFNSSPTDHALLTLLHLQRRFDTPPLLPNPRIDDGWQIVHHRRPRRNQNRIQSQKRTWNDDRTSRRPILKDPVTRHSRSKSAARSSFPPVLTVNPHPPLLNSPTHLNVRHRSYADVAKSPPKAYLTHPPPPPPPHKKSSLNFNFSGKCFKCLSPHHLIAQCRNPWKCIGCLRSGHSLRQCPTSSHPPSPPAPKSTPTNTSLPSPVAVPTTSTLHFPLPAHPNKTLPSSSHSPKALAPKSSPTYKNSLSSSKTTLPNPSPPPNPPPPSTSPNMYASNMNEQQILSLR